MKANPTAEATRLDAIAMGLTGGRSKRHSAMTLIDPAPYTIPATVLACDEWNTNADLILDVAQLGYLRDTDRVLDPTGGTRGSVWFKKWKPIAGELVSHDWKTDKIDFRDMPYENDSFDVVAFDPPYVCQGGRKTSTLQDMAERYGMNGDFKTPLELQGIINEGLCEAARVASRHVLVRCMDYVWGGKFWTGEYYTTYAGVEYAGLKLEDKFIMRKKHGGPQPSLNADGSRRVQRHARRNLSTLLVFKV